MSHATGGPLESHASCKGVPLISSQSLPKLTPLLLPLSPFYLPQSSPRRHSRYHLLLSFLYLGTQLPQQAQLLVLAHLHLHPSREILLPPSVTIALPIPLQPTEKKPSPSTPARRSASDHRTRRDNPHHSSSQNTRTFGRSYYETPVYQQSQPQRGRNNNRPDKTNSDPRPHPVPLLSLPTPWRTTTRQYYHHCKRIGHSDNNCYRQNWCDYCCRKGHTIDSCRSLLAQERHEKLCNQLTEQTAATSRLVDFIKHLAQPSRPGYTETQHQPLHPTQLPYTARNYDYQPAYEEEAADPYFC
ncbi:hypothetical protein Pmani_004035 [Petrolisthes manimaculis]|uniref:Uncharacterized protein n=1 Tax=Petrolisthes manimaculis TaxID=1843537 RepID=A0AAE1QHB8_9EUCA|nr:hypothetical protein Pmani_004035 [Petrolisthes manimaculis]